MARLAALCSAAYGGDIPVVTHEALGLSSEFKEVRDRTACSPKCCPSWALLGRTQVHPREQSPFVPEDVR